MEDEPDSASEGFHVLEREFERAGAVGAVLKMPKCWSCNLRA